MAKTSFIIPTYNRKDLTVLTIDSILKSTKGLDIEVIIVDDGSTDGTGEWVNEIFKDKKVTVFFQENSGAPTAINNGIKKSTGEFIVIIGSDDLIEANFLEPRLNAILKDNAVIGAYGPFDHFASEFEFDEKHVVPRHTTYPIEAANYDKILKRLLGGWYLPSPTILWKRSVFEKVGYMEPNLPVNQDVEFMFRVLKHRFPLVGVEGGRTLIRDHSGARVGSINSDERKVLTILELRRQFLSELKSVGLWEDEHNIILGRFLFDCWISYGREFPILGEEFLKFSNRLYPNINVRGGRLFEIAGKVLGPRGAIQLKALLQEGRRLF